MEYEKLHGNTRTVKPKLGSARKGAVTLSISLRGSLADEYLKLRSACDGESAEQFIEQLIVSEDPDLVRAQEPAALVIGRASELGQFPPDW